MFPALGTPPEFELRWDHAGEVVPVQFFIVYESDAPIPDVPLISAVVPGAAREAVVRLFADSGERHSRVSAVSFTGVEGSLSGEYTVDTTSRVAFIADKDTDEVFEFYAVPAGGGEPVKVSGTLVPGGNVRDFAFAWSPDGSRLAFVADKDTDGVFELYTVLAGGGTVTKVSGTLVPGGDVRVGFKWSPDGARLAFAADKDTNNLFELYAVPAGGGTTVKLSGTLVPGGDVSGWFFKWSPDGTRLAFLADKDTNDVFELYAVSAIGGDVIRLSGTLVPGGNVRTFAWSPLSNR